MELDEFVQRTLEAIVKGVLAARNAKDGAGVAPDFDHSPSPSSPHLYMAADDEIAFPVNFDVAVTVTDEVSKGGVGTIKVFSAGIDGKLLSSASETKATRVSFIVPVAFPRRFAREKQRFRQSTIPVV